MTTCDKQIIALWRTWIKNRPGRNRHYYEFYKRVICQDAELKHLTLTQVMESLVEFEPLRPWPRSAGERQTDSIDQSRLHVP